MGFKERKEIPNKKKEVKLLIWFFLAGFISGAVGASMLIWWWFKAHVKRISMEEMIHTLAEMESERNDK